MIKFISKKEVLAEPMSENKAVELGYARPNDDNHEWREGYHILYPDGYHSWCPNGVFQQSYKSSETFLDRLRIEANELADLQDKLNTFMKTKKFDELNCEEKKLLETQFGIMSSYLSILQLRIEKAESCNC